jgi:thiamine biosynthesis lipoprotein
MVDRLPTSDSAAVWPVWGTSARLVLTEPALLPIARILIDKELLAVEQACSRFLPDSEIRRAETAISVRVSPLLRELVATALLAAKRTAGAVDPTVGGCLEGLGYDRDLRLVLAVDRIVAAEIVPAPGWRSVQLHGDHLTVPPGVRLDLGATAKAWSADWCAQLIAEQLHCGVLIALGGDIATAGSGPSHCWQVLVQDMAEDPADVISLPSGGAIATSSTRSRRWTADGATHHHIVDPRHGRSVSEHWRSVTVAAHTCVDANTMSTAALVQGTAAVEWLRDRGVPARLLDRDGTLTRLRWPAAGDAA